LCPPDVVTLKSQCVQLVSNTGIETVFENYIYEPSSPPASDKSLMGVEF